MGDNVYIDSKDPKKMANAYEKLAKIPEFMNFKQQTPLIATWDDHDYAERDGGKDFEGKHDAKNYRFTDSLVVCADSIWRTSKAADDGGTAISAQSGY